MYALSKVGESYITEDCSQHCSCEKADSDLVCTSNECAANKECDVKEGIRACYCNSPYVSSGKECISKSLCQSQIWTNEYYAN